MKTTSYNPSTIEKDFAHALTSLKEQLESHLPGNKILQVEKNIQEDNPMIKFSLVDSDGDPHEVIIRIIQLPDK